MDIDFIMLIDDDRLTNFLSEMVINESNFCERVESFMSAKKALLYLQNSQALELPDIILVDINMPGMDGWEFLEEFSKIKFSTSNVPKIFMVTTSLNPDDKKRASEISTLSGFYRKPLTSDTLASIQGVF